MATTHLNNLPEAYKNIDVYAWLRDNYGAFARKEISREEYEANRAFLMTALKK